MFLTAKQVARLTDDQVLELAKGMGPAIIGPHLFERAEKVTKINPTGAFGPAIIGVGATQLEEKDDDVEDFDDDEDLDDDELEDGDGEEVDPELEEEAAEEEAAREAREKADLAALRRDDFNEDEDDVVRIPEVPAPGPVDETPPPPAAVVVKQPAPAKPKAEKPKAGKKKKKGGK